MFRFGSSWVVDRDQFKEEVVEPDDGHVHYEDVYVDEEGNEMELKRWLVGTMEMPEYFLKQDITFVELY